MQCPLSIHISNYLQKVIIFLTIYLNWDQNKKVHFYWLIYLKFIFVYRLPVHFFVSLEFFALRKCVICHTGCFPSGFCWLPPHGVLQHHVGSGIVLLSLLHTVALHETAALGWAGRKPKVPGIVCLPRVALSQRVKSAGTQQPSLLASHQHSSESFSTLWSSPRERGD